MGAEAKHIIEVSREHPVVLIPGSCQGFNDDAAWTAQMEIAHSVYSAGVDILASDQLFRPEVRGNAGVVLHFDPTEIAEGVVREIEIFVGPPVWIKGDGIWESVKEQPVTDTAREAAQRVLKFLVEVTTPKTQYYSRYVDTGHSRARLFTKDDGDAGDIKSSAVVPIQLEQNSGGSLVIDPCVTLKYTSGCRTAVEKILGVEIKFK